MYSGSFPFFDFLILEPRIEIAGKIKGPRDTFFKNIC